MGNHHDPELIRNHGDAVECYCADTILKVIPAYARFWATYIGNDGTQNYLPMDEPGKHAQETRIYLWERLYTLFESLALCWDIERQLAAKEQIHSYEDYANNLNTWFAFYAHLGRIHDMAEKVTDELKDKTLFAPFDPFYEQRHTAVHGIKTPMRWVENVLTAPSLGTPANWHLKMRWDELKKNDFEFLSTRVSETLRQLEPVVDRFFAQVSKDVVKFGLTPVIWPAPPATEDKKEQTIIKLAATQSCALANTSGVQHISGSGNGPASAAD